VHKIRQKLGIALVMAIGTCVSAAQTATPDLGTIVQRMTQAQADSHNNIRAYQVTREYRFYEGEVKPTADSNVIADVTYYPPDSKEYAIRTASGGGRGQHVVKKVLEHETQMVGRWEDTAMIDQNYKFALLGEETLNGRRCFILGVEPRRNVKELIKGRAWVDAEDFRIHQVQGEPAKSPSFWIKKLNLTLVFSEVEGMWLQTSVHASADVRMFGKNTLSERDLKYRVSNAVAAKKPVRRSTPQSNTATFVR